MAYKKVIFDDQVLIDLTTDTVTPETLMVGATAHNNIGEVITGIGTSDGTATEGDILAGKTAYVNGEKVTGNILCYKDVEYNIAHHGITWLDNVKKLATEYPISTAFYKNVIPVIPQYFILNALSIDASKILAGNTIAGLDGTATSDADAASIDLLQGRTAYVDGVKITGNIPIVNIEDTYIHEKDDIISIGSGYYPNDVQISIKPEAVEYLTPDNIRFGETILGITGIHTKEPAEISAYSPYILDGRVAYVNGVRVVGSFLSGLPEQIEIPFFLTDESGDLILDESERMIETAVTYKRA